MSEEAGWSHKQAVAGHQAQGIPISARNKETDVQPDS